MSVRSTGSANAPVILGGDYTVDTLPDPANNIDMYARVTDLFGGKRDLVLASQDQYGAYWQPVRPVYKGILAVSADKELLPMKTPSIITLTGSVPLGVNRKINLSTDRVFPGCQFVVRNKLSSMLGSISVLAGLTTLLNGLLLNSSSEYYYDPVNGWEQF